MPETDVFILACARVQVNFSTAGSKGLVLAYANLENVGA